MHGIPLHPEAAKVRLRQETTESPAIVFGSELTAAPHQEGVFWDRRADDTRLEHEHVDVLCLLVGGLVVGGKELKERFVQVIENLGLRKVGELEHGGSLVLVELVDEKAEKRYSISHKCIETVGAVRAAMFRERSRLVVPVSPWQAPACVRAIPALPELVDKITQDVAFVD